MVNESEEVLAAGERAIEKTTIRRYLTHVNYEVGVEVQDHHRLNRMQTQNSALCAVIWSIGSGSSIHQSSIYQEMGGYGR